MRDSQDVAPKWYCSKCGAEQYESDPEYVEDGRSYCEECFRERIEELLTISPEIVASRMGIERRSTYG